MASGTLCSPKRDHMIKTVEAVIDEKGNVKLLENVRLGVATLHTFPRTYSDKTDVVWVERSGSSRRSTATPRGPQNNAHAYAHVSQHVNEAVDAEEIDPAAL